LRYAVAAGIGLFLALIGLSKVHFVVQGKGTIVSFGGFSISISLFLFGLLVASVLVAMRVKGALTLAIVINSVVSILVFLVGIKRGWLPSTALHFPESVVGLPDVSLAFKLNIKGALTASMFAPVFTLLFTDMFDSISTFLGVAHVAGLLDEDGQPVNVDKALLVDAISTTISGLLGTSSGTTYMSQPPEWRRAAGRVSPRWSPVYYFCPLCSSPPSLS